MGGSCDGPQKSPPRAHAPVPGGSSPRADQPPPAAAAPGEPAAPDAAAAGEEPKGEEEPVDTEAVYERMRIARQGDGQVRPTPDVTFTREEVARHCTEEDCWIIIAARPQGKERKGPSPEDVPTVFDVSEFLRLHPGGARTIMRFAGQDCSQFFYRVHSNPTFLLPWRSPFIKPLGTAPAREPPSS
eukprot:TRINITY_DN9881_c0_g1_i1.p1 TRINITY_DN9881_c0_g1~~TRINITY_DN9881_c0_g1_i1.p1  ORF type:complete len:186 (+),score=27.59 TRINITY_DN9881_c0_g1_i1:71-628(+)